GGGGGAPPHPPWEKPGAMSSFKNVEMDVVIMIAVSARSQHRSKAMTGRIPQRFTKRLCNGFIGGLCATVASEDQSTDVDGIALAMFAKFRIDHVITAAALVRSVRLDTA